MINKILLAILLGFMLRFFATVGVRFYIKKYITDSEMKKKVGFHISIVSYMIGTVLKYVGSTLLIAYLFKEFFLN